MRIRSSDILECVRVYIYRHIYIHIKTQMSTIMGLGEPTMKREFIVTPGLCRTADPTVFNPEPRAIDPTSKRHQETEVLNPC